MNKELENELKEVGAEVLARMTAVAISTFKKELEVPRRWKKELVKEFAAVAMSYYYQIEIIEPFMVTAEEEAEADDDEY